MDYGEFKAMNRPDRGCKTCANLDEHKGTPVCWLLSDIDYILYVDDEMMESTLCEEYEAKSERREDE